MSDGDAQGGGTECEVVTSGDRPDLDEAAGVAFRERWPEFVFHDPLVTEYMPGVDRAFGRYSIYLLLDGQVAAGGWGVPLAWDGTSGLPEGYRTALVASVEDHEQRLPVNTLSFMAAAVARQYDKQGLSAQVLNALIDRAIQDGLSHVVAPIRPTQKHRYPQVAMAEYAMWTRSDRLSIDPWIRTHQRMGATILGPAPNSMVVPGTVAEWEAWADMVFPVSGSYVVPEALNLVTVDRDADLVIYREDNLWVQHR
jgi:GNAT superfamily N-acetyltransferase